MNETSFLPSEQIDKNDGEQWDALSTIQNDESWEEHLEKANNIVANDNERKSTPSSWGVHVFDDDFNPDVDLSADDLLARDINSTGRKKNCK